MGGLLKSSNPLKSASKLTKIGFLRLRFIETKIITEVIDMTGCHVVVECFEIIEVMSVKYYGDFKSKNVGISSANKVRNLVAESLRFPEPCLSSQG